MEIKIKPTDYMGKVDCCESELEGVFINKETGEVIIAQPSSCIVIATSDFPK